MAKQPQAGSEVEAYCTRCRMDLNHRVVALVQEVIKRVECLTCGGQHNFRAAKGATSAPRIRVASEGRSGGRAAQGARVTAAAMAEAERRRLWEKAIAGRNPSEFRAYRMGEGFAEGELVHHTKFGDGVVTEVRDQLKVEILFESGAKLLGQNLPPP